MGRYNKFLLLLIGSLDLINCDYLKMFNGMGMGKDTYNRIKDGCPEDGMRCDNKCIYESDNWNTPCLVKAPWAPCVQFQYPFYCPSQKICISVLEKCDGKCAKQEAYINPYNDYPNSFECGDGCANQDVPCNGNCTRPDGKKSYRPYACGNKCMGKYTALDHKICDGKCVDNQDKCDGIEEKIKGLEVKKTDCYGMINCSSCAPSYDFQCKDRKQCISTSDVCNEYNDCEDGSDEENCKCFNMINDCKDCNEKLGFSFKCKDGKKCINKWSICNGNKDCDDGSDELCIDDDADYCEHQMRLCNGKFLCNDKICTSEDGEGWCGGDFKTCNGECIKSDEPCNGKCGGGEEEEYGTSDLVYCNGKCISKFGQCNGECSSEKYNFACPNSITECVEKTKVCNDEPDCPGGTDETSEVCKCSGMIHCKECVNNEDFQCKSKDQCIGVNSWCDGKIDCKDGSDEGDCGDDSKCPGKYYCNGKYICKNEACDGTQCPFSNYQLCNGKCINENIPCGDKCLDYEGEESYSLVYCPDDNKCIDEETGKCGDRCLDSSATVCGEQCISPYDRKFCCNGETISEEQACNGKCNSDEGYFLCGQECVNENEYHTVTCDGKCMKEQSLKEDYKNNTKWRQPCGKDCNYGFQCKDGSVCLTLGSECDGVKDCPDGSDEDKNFCDSCVKYRYGGEGDKEFHCLTEPQYGRCSDDEKFYMCRNKCILKTQFCKETQTCHTRKSVWSDDSVAYNDFHCGDQTCVDGNVRCNGIKDCTNGKDEENCPDCSKRHGAWPCGDDVQCKDTPCDKK